MDFKEFFLAASPDQFSDLEVANLYFHDPSQKVRDIAKATNKSVAEVYRIIHQFGNPNRIRSNHQSVYSFADAGVPVQKIAELTGYTTRNVRYILKNRLTERSN